MNRRLPLCWLAGLLGACAGQNLHTESAGSSARAETSLQTDEPVDLLHAVETVVTTSSVYEEHPTQIRNMFDGDPDTAWNSATGDLVGAWLQVEVPPRATVVGAELIVGFTHENDGRDLFVANPRIKKLRVTRNGEDLGEFELDIEVRTLQRVHFSGTGGTYRLEVLEIEPGTQENWRETCVSEFRLLGSAPNAEFGEHEPRTGGDQLPE